MSKALYYKTKEEIELIRESSLLVGKTLAEVAKVIAFLASDASAYLCGETIEINGGMMMD